MSGSLGQLQDWLQPWARKLLALYPEARVSSVYRSPSQQAYLYRRFLQGQATYPVAPPGRSMHQYRRAFDLVAPAWALVQLGPIWERWGGTWGGRGQDPIHFEA